MATVIERELFCCTIRVMSAAVGRRAGVTSAAWPSASRRNVGHGSGALVVALRSQAYSAPGEPELLSAPPTTSSGPPWPSMPPPAAPPLTEYLVEMSQAPGAGGKLLRVS